MKIAAFVVGFFGAAFLVVPRIAAADPEPIGAGASLFVFGFLASAVALISYVLASARRSVPVPFAALIGALAGVAFYSVVGFVFPSLPLLVTVVLALSVSSVFSAFIPRLFRRVPNNSLKPTPPSGAA